MSAEAYTRSEMSAITAARSVEDNKVVFVGTGLPLMAMALAQRLHAPHLVILFEGGQVQPTICRKYMPFSPNDIRASFKAIMLTKSTDVIALMQRGHVDYGFIGGAQIDQYGNVNTSFIGDYRKPKVRLPGSGGANDIASLVTKTIIITKHEKRRFVEKVDFITSPGNVDELGREKHGLIFGKPQYIITGLAVMDYDPSLGKVRLVRLQPGVSVQQVIDNTGFKLLIGDDLKTNPPPTSEELRILREIDPEGRWVEHPPGILK
jgi:glutaconate CoA-transferase subunit B